MDLGCEKSGLNTFRRIHTLADGLPQGRSQETFIHIFQHSGEFGPWDRKGQQVRLDTDTSGRIEQSENRLRGIGLKLSHGVADQRITPGTERRDNAIGSHGVVVGKGVETGNGIRLTEKGHNQWFVFLSQEVPALEDYVLAWSRDRRKVGEKSLLPALRSCRISPL